MEEVIIMEYGSRFEKVFKEAMKSPDFWLEDIQLSFLDTLLKAMNTKNMSRKDLAEHLGKSQAYVSKTLNACSLNFTLKTMVNFSLALGLKLSLNLEDLESPVAESWKSAAKAETNNSVVWKPDAPKNNRFEGITEAPDGRHLDTLAA
ncbi:MAG: XRE family transcriptional regulator [Bacteroidia bacterium]|nr:XRE family transcriptional regulator [Bacteroidia bacterium]